jgi:polygalacturonase
MSMVRRDFLRSGIAVAAVAAVDCGCSSLTVHSPGPEAGSWSDVPGILARIVPPQFPARDFLVTDYGASADGEMDCRPAFAAAIAACNQAGGGRVVAPAGGGPYLLNGPIHLLSNVNLYLEEGSEILFGTEPSYYLPPVLIRYQGIRCYNYSPLIYAYRQSNIAITGSGRLNGQAYYWAAWENLANPDWNTLQEMVARGAPVEQRVFGSGHHLRLTMFEPYECTNVLLQGITFVGSPFWTLHPTFCTNVTIQGVTVLPGESNDDGCDPDSCSDVLIEGCSFMTNDDNVSIKAGFGLDAQGLSPSQNIVIQNCRAVSSQWGGITIGSQTGSVVQHVYVENCEVGNCDNAFFIKSSSASGGAVKSVFIRSCKASNCNNFLKLLTDNAGQYGPMPPFLSTFSIEKMSCGEATGCAFASMGDSRNPVLHLALSDIEIGSAVQVQQISNTFFVTSSNVTVGGKQVTISGEF